MPIFVAGRIALSKLLALFHQMLAACVHEQVSKLPSTVDYTIVIILTKKGPGGRGGYIKNYNSNGPVLIDGIQLKIYMFRLS